MKESAKHAALESATLDVDRVLDAIPSKEQICSRLEEIDREKKLLGRLLRLVSNPRSRREVAGNV